MNAFGLPGLRLYKIKRKTERGRFSGFQIFASVQFCSVLSISEKMQSSLQSFKTIIR